MSATDSNGVPLTRRQIREQAAAAAAAGAGAPSAAQPSAQPVARPEPVHQPQAAPVQRRSPQVSQPVQRARSAEPSRTPQSRPVQAPAAAPRSPVAQPSRVGHSRVQQPAREDPSATSSISRRSLREQTGVQRPVVVPPIQSNAIRTVDETGELSGLRDLGTGRSPQAAPSARPEVRESAPAQPPVRQPVQRQPIQRQPAQRQPAQPQQAQPQPEAAQPIRPSAPETAAAQPGRAQRQGLPTRSSGETGSQDAHVQAQPGMLGSDAARRPWPPVEPTPGAPSGAPAAFRTPQPGRQREAVPPGVDSFHQRISSPEEPAAPETGPQDEVFVEELPRWDAITAVSPAKAPARALPPVATRTEDEGLDDDDDDDFDDDDENEHKYTWLHYLILVAVAFVLGLIIWKVGLEGRGETKPPATTSSAGVVLQLGDFPSDPYL